MAKKVTITLVKSKFGHLPYQRATVKALGLNKIGSSVTVELNGPLQGMIKAVAHLVTVKEIA